MGGGSRRVRQVVVILAALAVAAVWVLVDHPLEGPVVWSLSADHGVHVTDVLIIVPLVWAWRFVARD
jgi:hypothetical protein